MFPSYAATPSASSSRRSGHVVILGLEVILVIGPETESGEIEPKTSAFMNPTREREGHPIRCIHGLESEYIYIPKRLKRIAVERFFPHTQERPKLTCDWEIRLPRANIT